MSPSRSNALVQVANSNGSAHNTVIPATQRFQARGNLPGPTGNSLCQYAERCQSLEQHAALDTEPMPRDSHRCMARQRFLMPWLSHLWRRLSTAAKRLTDFGGCCCRSAILGLIHYHRLHQWTGSKRQGQARELLFPEATVVAAAMIPNLEQLGGEGHSLVSAEVMVGSEL